MTEINPHLKNRDLPVAWLNPVTDITDVEIQGDYWFDDHVLCYGIEFNDQDGERRRIGLWWAGADSYADAKYANSVPVAKAETIANINQALESIREDMEAR